MANKWLFKELNGIFLFFRVKQGITSHHAEAKSIAQMLFDFTKEKALSK